MKVQCKLKRNILYVLLIFLSQLSFAESIILNYQASFIPGFDKLGNLQIAIRSYYKLNNHDHSYSLYFLNVNPITLATSEVAAADFKTRRNINGQPGYYTFAEILSTPYYKALVKYSSPPYKLQKSLPNRKAKH